MKMPKIAPAVAAVATLTLVATGCTSAKHKATSPTGSVSGSQGGSAGGSAKSNVLTIGLPDGPQTNNSNPFLNTSAAHALGYEYAIYEPLAMINDTRPTQKPIPWLAKSWTWNTGYTQIQITPRAGVKWSDGQPMTAQDIAYSLQLRKSNAALNAEGLPYKKISTDGKTVTVTFGTSQYVNQIKVLQLFIVPKHIWQNIKKPTTDLNQKPIGTGPYTLTTWTTQAVTLDRNKSYWHGQVAVPQLRYTSYSGNDTFITALSTGAAQWGQAFIADYKNVYLAKNPNNKAFFPAGLGVDFLALNTTKAPFNDVAVRQAANMVLDRTKASKIAESGVFPELTSATGIPTPAGNSFIAPQYKGQTYKVDVAGAKKILTSAGYTYSGSTLKDKSGKAVTVTLQDPAGWNDYDTDLQLIASSFKSIGISTTVQTPNVDAWTNALNTGSFDAALHWTETGISPWTTYSDMFNPAYYVPTGKVAAWNYGRYRSPAAMAAFKKYTDATTDAARQSALNALQTLFMTEMPAIPVNSRPALSEYSTKFWTGFPDDANPYANPQPTAPEAALIFSRLKPA